MKKKQKFSGKKILFVILACSIPAAWALLSPGFYGASDDIHIAWLYELHETVRLGQIPPRYVPDLSFGFGYPLFNFVFPFPFYLAEAVHLLGLSLVGSIKFVFLLSIPVSMILMYFFLKEFIESRLLALSGAVIYVYAPYRATEIYVRGAIGEIVVYMFLPLLALSLLKIAKPNVEAKQIIRWVGVGAIALASIVLSHNISAYMFLPFFAILALFLFFFLRKKAILAASLLIFVLGALISVYFWLPALYDSSLMKYDTVFNFWDHFPALKQLVTPYFGYGASVPGPYDGMSFFMGQVNIIIVALGTVIALFSWRKLTKIKKSLFVWAFIFFSFSMLMMNHRSLPIWEIVPNLAYFQFPWRFLTATTFLSPIFLLAFDGLSYKRYIALAAIVFAMLLNFSYFRPQDFLGRADDYYLGRYIPYPQVSEDYLTTLEEYLRLPRTAEARPDRVYPRFFSDKDGISDILVKDKLNAEATIITSERETVYYNKYYFPGWRATIDGQEVDISAGKPFGQIAISVPSGEHHVEVYFRETNFKILIDLISLTAFGFAVFISLKPKALKLSSKFL